MNFTDEFIFAMSWQIIAISLGAFLILMWLLKNKQANQTSSLYFLIPPFSAIMAYFVLNEQISYLDITGLLITSIGVFFVIQFKHKTF
jgi:drug/metabolite transporter (DMT)-like permease